jgi:hypothetical protein
MIIINMITIASNSNEIRSLLIFIPSASNNPIIGINRKSQMPSFFQFISKRYLPFQFCKFFWGCKFNMTVIE